MIPLLLGAISSVVSYSDAECHELGFEKGLSCISCKELGEFGLKSLQADCSECCEKIDDGLIKFKRGVLEVCSWKLGRYPHVSAFIDKKSNQFPNIEVKYKKGASPVIKLFGDSDKEEETVGIGNWNEETLEQFLEEKIEI